MSEQETIRDIAKVRVRNNDLWMRILAIAMEAAPDKTKAVLREINANDRKVSDLLGELVK